MTPCSDPKNDPDDWFIGRDGKQYPGDDFLTPEEVTAISHTVLRKDGETDLEHVQRVDAAISAAERDRKRKALQRRRHAREDCFGCYFRTNCLERALDEGLPHGTWGGYFEEQLREIRDEVSRRRRPSVVDQ